MQCDYRLHVLDLEYLCSGFEFKSKHKATSMRKALCQLTVTRLSLTPENARAQSVIQENPVSLRSDKKLIQDCYRGKIK